MKKLLFALVLCLGLIPVTGCYADEGVYVEAPPATAQVGTVEFCDDYGCRMVTAPYYYYGDELVYWDAHFGCWIGPHGYWMGGGWHAGWVGGYHGYYGAHFYHRTFSHPSGWRAGSGYHGYGHPGHFGGHGGHR
jgi:hypothetical protein